MIGKLLLACNKKCRIVPQVSVSAIHIESKHKEEFDGFSSMYTCGKKRRIVGLGT